MSDTYILGGPEGHTPIKSELLVWAKMFEKGNRHVALSSIGEVGVSTVFLGLDHSFGSGPPLLFETMVFGGALDEEQERYSTWEEAEEGHARMVRRVGGRE